MLYIILTCISRFMLFCYDLLLAVYFMFILEYRNDVRPNANLSDFLIWVQNGLKSSGDNSQHQQHIWPRTANEHTLQWWFKKSCKGDETLEVEGCSGQPSEVDKDQWKGSSKPILLQLLKKLLKNSMLTILTVVRHLKQIGKLES